MIRQRYKLKCFKTNILKHFYSKFKKNIFISKKMLEKRYFCRETEKI